MHIEPNWLDNNRFRRLLRILPVKQPIVRYQLDDVLVVKTPAHVAP